MEGGPTTSPRSSIFGFLEPQPMSQYVDNHSASSALSEQKVIKLLKDQFQSCFFFLT